MSLEAFSSLVYGRTPAGGRVVSVEEESRGPVLGGDALRVELAVTVAGTREGESRILHVLVIAPSGTAAVRGVFVGLNFAGNHSVLPDPAVRVSPLAVADRAEDAPPVDPGKDSASWPLETIVGRGYAVATLHCADGEVDRPGCGAAGIRGLFGMGSEPGTESGSEAASEPDAQRADDSWGAIGAWAWSLSRVREAVASLPRFGAVPAIAIGHSRLGKAALWAAAQDDGFVGVVSNQSGCGGASLFRHREGEDIAAITSRFPHWFAPALAGFADDPFALPVDQDRLLAAIAPRAVHVGSARGDAWSDPEGERLAVEAARPDFEARGVGHLLSYSIREGDHDITAEDWDVYLDVADRLVDQIAGLSSS